jgi:hypothetical protein
MPPNKAEPTPQPSLVPDNMGLTIVNERPSKPNAFSGSVLQSRESTQPTVTTLVKRASSIQSDSPKKPTLQFAIEDVDGEPNEGPMNLIPLKEVSDFSLVDVFALVSSRSGQPLEELEHVTFRYQWGDMVTLVVNRYAGEETWKGMKSKMSRIFKNVQKEYRKKKQFLVWVYCGDRTVLKEDSGDEEED